MAGNPPKIIITEVYDNGAVVDVELESEAPRTAVNENVMNSSEETPSKGKGEGRSDDATFFATLLTHIDGSVAISQQSSRKANIMSSAKETAKSSGTPFSEKELALIAACVEFGSLENVDFNKVAERAGYKDAKNAKVMWSRLKTNKFGIKGNAKSDGDGTGSSTPKTPTKARANRVTKSKKTPSKAQVKADQSDDDDPMSEEPKEEVTAVKDEEGQDE